MAITVTGSQPEHLMGDFGPCIRQHSPPSSYQNSKWRNIFWKNGVDLSSTIPICTEARRSCSRGLYLSVFFPFCPRLHKITTIKYSSVLSRTQFRHLTVTKQLQSTTALTTNLFMNISHTVSLEEWKTAV